MPRPVVEHRSASKEEYDKFCKLYPNVSITFEEYSKIIYTHNELYANHILETGEKVKVPYGFGYLSINKKLMKRYFESGKTGEKYCILPVDWKRTKAEGKKIYLMNFHTEGYRFKWFWFAKEARIKHSDIWVFKPSRKCSLLLHKYLISKSRKYQDVYREWYKGKSR